MTLRRGDGLNDKSTRGRGGIVHPGISKRRNSAESDPVSGTARRTAAVSLLSRISPAVSAIATESASTDTDPNAAPAHPNTNPHTRIKNRPISVHF